MLSRTPAPEPLRNPVACGGLGDYDPNIVARIAGYCEVEMATAHRGRGSILLLDREPLRWRGRGVRGFAWTEAALPVVAEAQTWRRAAVEGDACGLVVTRSASFVHSSVSGTAPVYHLTHAGATYFATRLDPLVRGVDARLQPDWEAWFSIFCLRSPVASRTTFAEAGRLEPLTTLKHGGSGPRVKERKWPWADPPELSLAEGIEPLAVAFEEAMAPLRDATSMLSGGLDSRILAGVLGRQGANIEALTCVEDDGGKRSEHEMTPAVAAAVGARHQIVDRDPGRNWDDWVQRITESEFMLYGNAGLVPLFEPLAALGRPAVDGFALDTFSVRGTRFYDATMFSGEASRKTSLALWRSIRRHKAPGVPTKAFEPELARRIARRSRSQFMAATRGFRGNPNEVVLGLYRTRTLRGVSVLPAMLGRHTRIFTPATTHRVASAFLAIRPEEKVGFALYDALLDRLAPQTAGLPSAAHGIEKRPQSRPQARFSQPMVDGYQDLLATGALRPHMSADLEDAITEARLGTLIRNPGYHRAVMMLATFELWARRYERQLGKLDLAPIASAVDARSEDLADLRSV